MNSWEQAQSSERISRRHETKGTTAPVRRAAEQGSAPRCEEAGGGGAAPGGSTGAGVALRGAEDLFFLFLCFFYFFTGGVGPARCGRQHERFDFDGRC